jgi:hypothetical protein
MSHGSMVQKNTAGAQRLGSTKDAMIEHAQHSIGFWPQKQPHSSEKLKRCEDDAHNNSHAESKELTFVCEKLKM